MGKRWRIHPHDADRIAQLQRTAGVPTVVAQLLLSRGIDDAGAVERFLNTKLTRLHDPHDLPGVTAAAERIAGGIQDDRRTIIYGDYDADGMTGTALLVRCLRLLGANVGYYVPNRIDEGYGLNAEALARLAGHGAKTVVTVDCGIASPAEADVARQLGVELIVTDHHEFGPQLPDAAVLVHPRLPGSRYPFGGLCGAGVALKLAWAVCQQAEQATRLSPRMRNYLLEAIALVAIGTVADVVPLLDENRILVCHGLTSLRQRPSPGLAALLAVAKLDDKSTLVSDDIGFALAPRLNAAGRLGQAQLAVELLATDSTERAVALAEYIDELNKNRQSLERSVYLAAHKLAKQQFDPQHDPALVLAGRGWHPGVIGIVAGQLAEKFNVPVVLLALDTLAAKPAAGSARSAAGVNLHQALAACDEHLLSHGGHEAAAGLRIDEAAIDAFRVAFCEQVAGDSNGEQDTVELKIDAEAPLSQLTYQTVEQIDHMAPFGMGNPRPVLCASGVQLAAPPRRIGAGERHLSLKLKQHGVSLRAVAFGRGDWADRLVRVDGPVDIAYRAVINEFRGRRSVELQLEDWRLPEG